MLLFNDSAIERNTALHLQLAMIYCSCYLPKPMPQVIDLTHSYVNIIAELCVWLDLGCYDGSKV